MSNKTYNNPWAGLSSYQDPEGSDVQLKFCGRDNESFDVMRLIDDNIFVTLYGKSGTGKTSLLNAGVFPRLRREQYLPVSIRLGMDAIDMSFQQCILTKLDKALEGKGHKETIDVVPMPDDEQSPAYLWSYFARTRFVANDDSTLFPVVVFDQFEEVFRHRRQDAEALLRQIYFMMDENHALSDRMVDGRPYQYDFNFRFVASIREDDLYRLEDSIDNCYLPDMKRCRYRLRSLSEQGARDAVLIPGEGLFRPEEEEGIVRTIMEIARNKDDDSISTNILSLICSRIFVDYQKSGAEFITPALVDTFVKGNPFEQFYNEATRGFSNREKNYIEDHLVDSTGRRNSVPEADFLLHVKNGAVLLEGTQKILQRTSVSSDGSNYRIELIHDSFCEPLVGQKEKRKQRRRVRMFAITILVACCVIGGAWFYMAKLQEANGKMMENQSRAVADKAIRLVDEGDACTAQLLALEALPKDLNHPNRPYTFEAESALRRAYRNNSAVMQTYESVAFASFSPDGKRIVSASWDVRIWDAETGQCLDTLKGHTDHLNSALFSPDGKRIVTSSKDSTVRIWNAQTGKCLHTLKGHTNEVRSASFSPDGNRIVSAGDTTIRIWDAQTGRVLRVLKRNDWHVCSAFFSPDGKLVVSGSQDGALGLWDVQTGKCLKVLTGHKVAVNSVSFSPDCKWVVSSSFDTTVRLWDIQTGKLLRTFEGHTAAVNSAFFSPDGKYLVSASDDNTVRIWDAQTRECLRTLEGHTEAVWSALFSPDGNRIVSASWGDGSIRIWDVSYRQSLHTLTGHTHKLASTSFSPDSKRIVSAGDRTVRIWDAETGECLHTLKGHTDLVKSASFSPDGKRIVSAGDTTVRIWDAQTGQQLRTLKGHDFYVYSASFSPDGKRIVSASWDVRIWDAETGQCLHKLEGHTNFVWSVSFSPDSKRIVSASFDKTIRIWDAQTGQCLRELKGHYFWIYSAFFSPDGKKIVSGSGDRNIRIWDAETGQCLQTWGGGIGSNIAILIASYSPDGKRIIAAAGNTISILDAQTGQIIQKLEEHSGDVLSASFSPDGKRIVSASADNTIKIWDFPPLQQLIDQTRERFKNRKLSEDERRKYYLE